ncbi:hypothetical protein GUITHDRAFT_152227 [Guillardia theta CCMP2712]|uniref:Transmembrane protein 218 n=1 Tax=Guillardia theta (strain CCMP2712) TaxID=905079 RepID=L1JFI2_GUITC|nr:hypothetical protein GUITHDRAFT_152227 [Guillardia theta CCMP2712]EKX46850.1 hypothetical protein GUITHDRAFT_152227 [Guillardia theta CCMP2712]|eukprot:XP_005833830.1 hypothetical protein GUITHDRAFT_152227 [Guillardia theta CCMP2712]
MSIGSSNTRRLRILVGLFALTAVLLCGLITWEQTETNEEQMWPRQIAGDGMRRADAADRKLLMLSPSLYVAGVGDGLFSLFILYVLLIISCAVGCNIRNGCPLILISVIVVLVVTLVLVLSPRVPRQELQALAEQQKYQPFDRLYIWQALIMSLVWLGLLIALISMFLCHCIKPVYAKSLED